MVRRHLRETPCETQCHAEFIRAIPSALAGAFYCGRSGQVYAGGGRGFVSEFDGYAHTFAGFRFNRDFRLRVLPQRFHDQRAKLAMRRP